MAATEPAICPLCNGPADAGHLAGQVPLLARLIEVCLFRNRENEMSEPQDIVSRMRRRADPDSVEAAGVMERQGKLLAARYVSVPPRDWDQSIRAAQAALAMAISALTNTLDALTAERDAVAQGRNAAQEFSEQITDSDQELQKQE